MIHIFVLFALRPGDHYGRVTFGTDVMQHSDSEAYTVRSGEQNSLEQKRKKEEKEEKRRYTMVLIPPDR